MTIEITYVGDGLYEVAADGAVLGHAATYHEAYGIETSYLETKASNAMGGDPLLIEVQNLDWANGTYTYDTEPTFASRYIAPMFGDAPLLADCAAVIRRCLGSTTGAQGIVDELRRVERRLMKEGW